jgi:cytochrome c-type biogenesis protein CcmH/NrfG
MAGNLLPQATLMITKRILLAKTMGSAHMRQGRLLKLFLVFFAACVFSLLVPRMVSAQASSLEIPPPPPPAEPPPPPEPPKPVFDPLRANKSLEVGSFYMKRGNYDAAIDRFTDATQFEPGLARSYSLLGEAYEHKGDVDNALVAYRKYLQLLHNGPDRDKVQKHIEKLEGQSGRAQEQTKEKSG